MYTAKPIPTLTGEAADRFEQMIQEDNARINLGDAYTTLDAIMSRSIL